VTEHSELFTVEVTEGGEGHWKYDFRSQVRHHLTDMLATDALGWRYLLERWAGEIERKLASAPSIDAALSQCFRRHSLAVGRLSVIITKPPAQ
jgi:hypothetical protein